MDIPKLKQAVKGQGVVYANLSGDLGKMAENIFDTMKVEGAKHLIFISSIEIYDTLLKHVLKPYREAADLIEASGLNYTILRAAWYTNTNEIDYETTRKKTGKRFSNIEKKSCNFNYPNYRNSQRVYA